VKLPSKKDLEIAWATRFASLLSEAGEPAVFYRAGSDEREEADAFLKVSNDIIGVEVTRVFDEAAQGAGIEDSLFTLLHCELRAALGQLWRGPLILYLKEPIDDARAVGREDELARPGVLGAGRELPVLREEGGG
jgi:hypothetical protein